MKRAILLLTLGFAGGFAGTLYSPRVSEAAQEQWKRIRSSAEAPAKSSGAPVANALAARMPVFSPQAVVSKPLSPRPVAAPVLVLANVTGMPQAKGPCPADMVSIEGRYCIDRYEAGLVEKSATGERAWPHNWPVDGHAVRAVSKRGIFPQSYISGKEAASACHESGKRLCKATEWKQACQGPQKTSYPYGSTRAPGKCNDAGKSPISRTLVLGGSAWSWDNMNQPVLMTLPDTVAPSGAFDDCVSGYGVHDMVGNVHEWVDDASGTFAGGYFQDVELNGQGCNYQTTAHEFSYHDYSTGFRCCADAK